jgi:hypothetical protein
VGVLEWGVCAAAALLAGASGAAAEARPTARATSGSLRIPAQAQVAQDKVEKVQLELGCVSGKRGGLSFKVVLSEAAGGFDLAPFEGPGGIGETRPLATWSVQGPQPVTLRGTISGWYGVDGDGFLLASTTFYEDADLVRLARAFLAAGDEPLRLVVASLEAGAPLEVEAVAGARHAAIARVLAPCLAPGG